MGSSLRALPSVDALIKERRCQDAVERHGREAIVQALRETLAEIRKEAGADLSLPAILDRFTARIEANALASLRPVINLTGTILHTNLGRACLPEEAVKAAAEAHRNPCNVEFDLPAGERGDRDEHVAPLIRRLTGAEAALAVNNNAAAVVLALASLAAGRKVLISRGELVEIGGSFRIPEIIAAAGCRLCEVGTTNRTHLADYERALDGETAAILKVHTSNYEIVGFTAAPEEEALAALAHRHGLPFIFDLGAGSLVDLSRWGLPAERTPADALRRGADLVTFSGDKLLGGPQAGLMAGGARWVDRLRTNPLRRALRLDKGRVAALEAVLRLYLDEEGLARRLPTLRLLARSVDEIRHMATRVHPALAVALEGRASVDVAPCESLVGSGSQPMARLASFGLRVSVPEGENSASRLEAIARDLRQAPVPVLGRIHAGALWLDCRALEDEAAFSTAIARG